MQQLRTGVRCKLYQCLTVAGASYDFYGPAMIGILILPFVLIGFQILAPPTVSARSPEQETGEHSAGPKT